MWSPTDDLLPHQSPKSRLPARHASVGRPAGMTLIELLLAIVLLVAVVGTVSGLVYTGLRAQAQWGQSLAPYQRVEQVFNQMEQDIESAQPLFGIPVAGATNQLEFARMETLSIAEAPAKPEWVRVVYRLSPSGEGTVLIREAFLWKNSASPAPDPVRRETLLQLTDGRFEFGNTTPDHQLVWVNAWDGKKNGIPRFVRLTCTIMGGPSLSRVVRHPAGQLPAAEPS